MRDENAVLLRELRPLKERRKYSEIADLLGPIEYGDGPHDPELILSLAFALSEVRLQKRATRVLESCKQQITSLKDAKLWRRWANLYTHQLRAFGKFDECEKLLGAIVESATDDADDVFLGLAYNGLGILHSNRLDVEDALAAYARFILAGRRTGKREAVASGHYNTAVVLREAGRPEEAEVHFHYAEEYYRSVKTPEESCYFQSERALLSAALGNLEAAEVTARMAVETTDIIESSLVRAYAFKALGLVMFDRQAIADGIGLVERGYREAVEAGDLTLEAELSADLANLLLKASSEQLAFTYYQRARDCYLRMGAQKRIVKLDTVFEGLA